MIIPKDENLFLLNRIIFNLRLLEYKFNSFFGEVCKKILRFVYNKLNYKNIIIKEFKVLSYENLKSIAYNILIYFSSIIF